MSDPQAQQAGRKKRRKGPVINGKYVVTSRWGSRVPLQRQACHVPLGLVRVHWRYNSNLITVGTLAANEANRRHSY